jgi:hypothetical protein
MTIDPEELVTLKNHGTMKLRSAVARTMMLLPKERKRATIVRKGEPAVLKFEQIRDLAAQWSSYLRNDSRPPGDTMRIEKTVVS